MATKFPEGAPLKARLESESEALKQEVTAFVAKQAKLCPCGSGEVREEQYDARGIFLCFTCSKCERERLSHYRPDVLTDPGYWHDEPIDEED